MKKKQIWGQNVTEPSVRNYFMVNVCGSIDYIVVTLWNFEISLRG